MNTLKHGTIAAALAFATTGLAFANETPKLADPATMTDDEKATVQLLNDFRACGVKVADENRKIRDAAEEKASIAAKARNEAAQEETRKAMLAAGISEDHIGAILGAMLSQDQGLLAGALAASSYKDPQEICLKEAKIDTPEAANAMNEKLRAIARKYGSDVLAPKQ